MTKQFAVAIGAGLILAACGGSDDSSDLFNAGGSAGSSGSGTGGSGGSSVGGSSGSSAGGSSGSATGGTAGSSAGGSSGSGSGGDSGTGGDGGSTAGSSGSGGSGGDAGSAAGGSSGSASGGAGGGCTKVEWCKDSDSDSYGDPSTIVESCSSPGASYLEKSSKPRACEDCNDLNDLAYPNSTHCDGLGYPIDNGKVSFDFNCDAKEIPCHDFLKASANGCQLTTAGGVSCSGSGYLKTARSGPGVDPYCGSDQYRNCTLSGDPGSFICKSTVSQYNPVTCK